MNTIHVKRFLTVLTTTGLLVAGAILPSVATAAPAYSSGQHQITTSLQLGDRGPAVASLQRQLNANGANLVVDGIFGPLTQRAVDLQQGFASTGRGSSTYTVQAGDTFWLIGQNLGVPLNQLLAANPNVDPYQLDTGMTINLPGAQSAVPAAQNTVSATSAGAPSSGQQAMSFVATAYGSSAAENGGSQWAGLDYFGNPLVQGRTIAVDPNVIPLGSTVYVSGYNWAGLPSGGFTAQATDVGSAIKGNRIDIYLNGSSQAVSSFGMQNVQVTILK